MVRSACSRFSVLYGETKSHHPSLKFLCEGLENSVALFSLVACHKVAPVMTKLKPQISFANDVACKSLDWLEATFPVLHTPTDQVIAGVRSKVLEVQDAMTIVAHGTIDCMQHAVTCVMAILQQVEDQPLVGGAVSESSIGLQSELNISEAQICSPTDDADGLVDGFQADVLRRYSVRLLTVSITLCRRTIQLAGVKMQPAQIMDALSTSSCHLWVVQTSWLVVAWGLEQLPQCVQHQVVSAFFLITQLYIKATQQSESIHDTIRCLYAAPELPPTPQKVVKKNSRARRPTSMIVLKSGCMVKGSGQH
nr:perilipin-2-like isoform X2 [Doryrhamphus excisus]